MHQRLRNPPERWSPFICSRTSTSETHLRDGPPSFSHLMHQRLRNLPERCSPSVCIPVSFSVRAWSGSFTAHKACSFTECVAAFLSHAYRASSVIGAKWVRLLLLLLWQRIDEGPGQLLVTASASRAASRNCSGGHCDEIAPRLQQVLRMGDPQWWLETPFLRTTRFLKQKRCRLFLTDSKRERGKCHAQFVPEKDNNQLFSSRLGMSHYRQPESTSTHVLCWYRCFSKTAADIFDCLLKTKTEQAENIALAAGLVLNTNLQIM